MEALTPHDHYSLSMLNEAYRENTRRDIEWLASRLHAKHCRQCDIVRSLIADLEGARMPPPLSEETRARMRDTKPTHTYTARPDGWVRWEDNS